MSTADKPGIEPAFPEFVPGTRVHKNVPTLHVRQCVLRMGEAEQQFEKSEIRLGTTEQNDIVIEDDTVSRHHATIFESPAGYLLRDEGSTNGTYVDGVRIKEAYLHPGCTLTLGQTQLEFTSAEAEVEVLPSPRDRCGSLVGGNAKMRAIYSVIERLAPTAMTVVVTGPTGTGKEVVAQTIHGLSSRAAGPLVIFDCGAVPANLIESELFGHEKGSFTGAIMTRKGVFELADGGTLFLDELGELPLELQPKLLRALEQREIRRVGSGKSISIDVRIIAATNRDLETEVQSGRFRRDLYYRLAVARITLPMLRERSDDIPMLAQHIMSTRRFSGGDDRPKGRKLSPAALTCLTNYSWPGNVRELINVLERAAFFCDGQTIEPEHLPEHVRTTHPGDLPRIPSEPSIVNRSPDVPEIDTDAEDVVTFKNAKERWVTSFEREYIVSLLQRHGGNISHAAREADIDRKYFRKLMKKYGVTYDRSRTES